MTKFSGSTITSDTKSVEFYRILNTTQGEARNLISRDVRGNNWNDANNKGNFVICMSEGTASTDRRAAILLNTDNSSVRSIFGNNINTELSPGLCG
jgi:hypothetical protein